MDEAKKALLYIGVSLTASVAGTVLVRAGGILITSATLPGRMDAIEQKVNATDQKVDSLLIHFGLPTKPKENP